MDSTAQESPRSPAQRLAWRMVWIVVAVTLLQFAALVAISNLTAGPKLHASLSDYFSPMYLAEAFNNLGSSCLLLGVLAWALVTSRIEHRGEDALRPRRVLGAFAVLYVAAGVLGALYLEFGSVRVFGLLSGALHHQFILFQYQPVIQFAGVALMMIFGVTLFVILLCGTVIAALWFGRRPASSAPAAAAPKVPARHAVPLLCGLFVAAIQWQFQAVGDSYFYEYRMHHPWSLIDVVTGPPLAFVLAWAGARWGAGRPQLLRPLRALSASGASLAVQFSLFLALVLVIALAFQASGGGYVLLYAVYAAVPVLVIATLVWLALSVVLMYWFSGIFYRPFQAGNTPPVAQQARP